MKSTNNRAFEEKHHETTTVTYDVLAELGFNPFQEFIFFEKNVSVGAKNPPKEVNCIFLERLHQFFGSAANYFYVLPLISLNVV